jgi:POT family proton-dependent oligopeptide transporter
MWERFSYYGMRAILVLYIVAPIATGGLGMDTVTAATIYGIYTGSVYGMSIPGGWVADRLIGGRKAVLAGGVGIAIGNALIAFGSVPMLYCGLAVIILGTGLLKPNVSAMVGALYAQQDTRRDSGFSIFYMGINLGAILSPLLCGYLAQRINWRLGFGMAAFVMVLGLIQFISFRSTIAHVGGVPDAKSRKRETVTVSTDQSDEGKRIAAIAVLFVFSTVFWMSFEQAGSSLNLFADQLTHNSFLGFNFPSSWFQSVEPIFVVSFAPLMSWLWLRLDNRQPSSPSKFTLGLVCAAVAFGIITYASTLTGSGRVSPLWLILVYFFQGIGELLLSPVGLSTTTKLAPSRMSGLMMGVWFLSISVGNYLAGLIARFYKPGPDALVFLFGSVALLTILSAIVLTLMVPYMRKLMGTVR